MNDICNTSRLLNTILFADDTTVFYSHKDINILCNTLNVELNEVVNWFKANKLSLNAKKTNLMFLGTRFKIKNTIVNEVYLDKCKLTRVHEAKFLGITIDEHLTWKKHVSDVSKKCSRNIGVLNKVKSFLPTNNLHQLYCTLVLPYINYGILLWGNATKECINKIFRLQKRALRIISNSHYLCPSKPLFEKYNVLNIFNIYHEEMAIFMYKYRHDLLPRSFDGAFIYHHENHSYNTRNKDDFKLPLQKGLKTVFSIGPKIWNQLPEDIKSSSTLYQFKTRISFYISTQ
jgi:hypothetical protein